MKKYIILSGLFWCLLLSGCITEYEAKGVVEVSDILVVEGVITDDETYISLSRSVKMTDNYYYGDDTWYVNNAEVYVECDDGTRSTVSYLVGSGRYLIETGKLSLDRKYRLIIHIDEHEYCSDYSYPLTTPEFDIIYTKKAKGQPVNIHVSTEDPDKKIMYYRWSYVENWEIQSYYVAKDHPEFFYCWETGSNRNLLIGSADKMVDGKLVEVITEIPPYSRRLSVLYRIDVKQNAISKRAYDYFANIKKNVEQTGSIFAPIPSELRGNIICTTDTDRPVIGYIDISTTTSKRLYISPYTDNLYEPPFNDCQMFPRDSLIAWFGEIPDFYIELDGFIGDTIYSTQNCADCNYYGTKQKPEDWPNDHE